MNVIDMIDGNLFLKKLFPDGLAGPLYLGQFGLEGAGRFSMNIHTRQRPAIEVAKWGIYGKHYDVIVIELLGCGVKNVSIENWINADYAVFDFSKKGQDIRIAASGAEWAFEATVASFNFQRCSTYINGEPEEY